MNNIENPFQITTPEDLSAEETVNLFVDVFSDFEKLKTPSHTFLVGPRGVGKSMMFRYLQPDCQCFGNKCSFENIPFFAIYIPIKNTTFSITEFRRLDNKHADRLFNEHWMVCYIFMRIIDYIRNDEKLIKSIKPNNLLEYCNENFDNKCNKNDSISILNNIYNIIDIEYKKIKNYAKKLAFSNNIVEYDGELYDYIDFLIPNIEKLKEVNGFPKCPIYLLIDDAHNLSNIQTEILNTWVYSRTSRKVSLKISTQYNYKTFYTVSGEIIESPHDYYQIDVSTIYTSNIDKYRDRIKEIVEKRLKLSKINKNAYEYFPEYKKQEDKIKEIEEKYIKEYDDGKARGNNRTDDARRYARADYIKNLGNISKSSSKYFYAGFEQLVNLSSGIVRLFIESANSMYSIQSNKNHENKLDIVDYIEYSVQNYVIRDEANRLLFDDLEKLKVQKDENNKDENNKIENEDIEKLFNLISGLGALFYEILISNKSERKIFSFVIPDDISKNTENILNLGIQLGYFHKDTIGRKDPNFRGRTRLYVMNRKLAPIWTLDPNGLFGYLTIKNKYIESIIKNPKSYKNYLDYKYYDISLFGEEE